MCIRDRSRFVRLCRLYRPCRQRRPCRQDLSKPKDRTGSAIFRRRHDVYKRQIQRNAEEFGNYCGDKRRAEAALTTSHSRSYALFDTVNRRNAYRGFQSVENFAQATSLASFLHTQ